MTLKKYQTLRWGKYNIFEAEGHILRMIDVKELVIILMLNFSSQGEVEGSIFEEFALPSACARAHYEGDQGF